jgi:hypothetical protein
VQKNKSDLVFQHYGTAFFAYVSNIDFCYALFSRNTAAVPQAQTQLLIMGNIPRPPITCSIASLNDFLVYCLPYFKALNK